METLKDIAAVLGVILSLASVGALLSKHLRHGIAKIFKKFGGTDDLKSNVTEIKTMLEKHIEDDDSFRKEITKANDINIKFTLTQCRNIIKNIFYRYNSTKILPLYEKKTLIHIRELYIDELHGNSFATLLLDEMDTWEVDYESTHDAESD